MCSLNVNGLSSLIGDNNFKAYCEQFDVIGFQETWQKRVGEFNDALVDYDNFDCPRKSSIGNKHRGSGGVSVFVKTLVMRSGLLTRIYEDLDDCVVFFIDKNISKLLTDIVLILTYIPPERSAVYELQNDNGIDILREKLLLILSDMPNVSFIVAGDMNARVKDLLDYIPNDDVDAIFGDAVDYPGDTFDISRNTRDTELNRFGKTLIDLCCTYDIHLLNGRFPGDECGNFTCTANRGKSVVDYFIMSTTLFDRVSDFYIDIADFSDHFPVVCSIKLGCDKHLNNETVNEQLRPIVSYKWNESLRETFRGQFETMFNDFYTSVNDTNVLEKRSEFEQIFKTVGKCMKQRQTNKTDTKRHTQPEWWDNDCDIAKSTKYRSLRRFRLTNMNSDLQRYLQCRTIFRNLCRAKRLRMESKRRTELLEDNNIPKSFWSKIKRAGNSKTRVDSTITGEAWEQYFTELFKADPNTVYSDEHYLYRIRQHCDDSPLDNEISEAEIISSVRSLRGSCAAGIDGLYMDMFKCTLEVALPYMKQLFNSILSTGRYPTEWSENMITPVHKKGERNNPNNYRAITLVTSISKIFTKVLSNRLTSWVEDNDIIDEAQAGFRSGYSTVDNIFSLQSVIQKYLTKRGGRLYVFYIDYLKAFDNCAHPKIWECVARKGINPHGKFLTVFKSMYAQLKSCVKLPGGLTGLFRCEKGTKQGCVSSTIIFSIFINDLISHLQQRCRNGIFITQDIDEVQAFMFADDIASVADTVNNLQCQINYVSEFCNATGMQINNAKSKIMVFRNGGHLRSYERWHYRSQEIEVVSFYKYLGAYFTPKLSWSRTVNALSQQASKAVNVIFRYQRYFGYFTYKDLFKLFDAMVTPILTYSADIWGFKVRDEIENVHIKFCKRVACLHQNVANFFALSECGRLPLSINYKSKCVKYWAKLTQMDKHRYPRQCYIMLRQHDDAGRSNWVTQVKLLLFENGFGYAWLANDIGDVDAFVTLFKTRIRDSSKQMLHSEIDSSPKSLHYKLYKSALDPEAYLTSPFPHKYKQLLSNFRCSGHQLMIEKGRHLRIERDLRLCLYCQQQGIYIVEDEVHFLLHCPMYKTLRQTYFFNIWSDSVLCIQLFIRIMSDSNRESIMSLAKYLEAAFDLRKQFNNV